MQPVVEQVLVDSPVVVHPNLIPEDEETAANRN
jgi:hypothetical protein